MGKRQVHFTDRYAQTISCCGLKASCCVQFISRYTYIICRYGQQTGTFYRSICSTISCCGLNASCCEQFTGRYARTNMSLWANDKPLSIAYRSCSNYRLLWTKSKLLCTIYRSLYWNNMSLWAKYKPLSIVYRSLFSNYRLLSTKSNLLCTFYKSLYLNNMSLWAKDRYILQIVMLKR